MNKIQRQSNKRTPKVSETNSSDVLDKKRKFIAKFNGASNEKKASSKISSVHLVSGINICQKDVSISQKRLPNVETGKEETLRSATEKLRTLECQLQKLQSILSKAENQITTKNREIDTLKRQVKSLSTSERQQKLTDKKTREKRRNEIENSKYLHRRCVKLEQKVKEMEHFLRDYGLIWIGKECGRHKVQNQIDNYINECYDQLIINISQLNAASGRDEIVIQRSDKGASFKSPTCMSLKFYKNGLVVQNGLLRPYYESSAKSFIRDILDGYFPSELQKDYPNGVSFKVEDRRNEVCKENGVGFSGQGYKLGKISDSDKKKVKCNSNANSNSSRRFQYKDLYDANVDGASTSRSNRSSKLSNSDSIDSDYHAKFLAFHDGHCSNTHIQSHINAVKKASYFKLNSSCASLLSQISGKLLEREDTLFLTPRNTGRHNSLDRSSFGICTKSSGNQFRLRSRSVNSLDCRFTSDSSLGSRVTSLKSNIGSIKSGCERSRIDRKTTPLSVYVNEPSKRSGEFRLKIRSLNGCILYLVHVTSDDTVGGLYKLMNKTMPNGLRKKFKIVMNGPGLGELENMDFTLGNYGISMDSVLHLSSN